MQAFLAQAPTAATPASMSLTQEELNEVAGWGAREKFLFLQGYQWLAAMTSSKIQVLGTSDEYKGFLPVGIKAVLDVISASETVVTRLSPETLTGQTQLSAAAKDASKTSGSIDEAMRRWRPLRARVVQELVGEGANLEFEYFGDSPNQPGVLVLRRISEQGVTPEYSVVYSTKTPQELIADGLALQDKYAEIGVQFQRPTMGQGATFPILASIITLVTAVLVFFWTYEKVQKEKNFNGEVVKAIESQTAQEADALLKINNANALLADIFQQPFPWTAVIGVGAVASVVGLVAYQLFGKKKTA